MHTKAAFVFWVTLILYLLTLFTVSYVGVYLTYIALPLIVLSGLIMVLTKPKESNANQQSNLTNTASQFLNATTHVLDEANQAIGNINNSLTQFNLKNERTKKVREEIHQLKLLRAKPNIELQHAKSEADIKKFTSQIAAYDAQIALLNEEKLQIENQCDLEFIRQGLESKQEIISLPVTKNENESTGGLKFLKLLGLLGVIALLIFFLSDKKDNPVSQHQECVNPLWTTASSLVVRDSPSIKANKLSSLPINSKICAEEVSNGWVKVAAGWVSANYTQNYPLTSEQLKQNSQVIKVDPVIVVNENGLTNKNWEVHRLDDVVFYFGHGSKVYGHQFGFFKKRGLCDTDMIWISLSTDNADLIYHKGDTARFQIDVNNISFALDISLSSVQKNDPMPLVAQFTNVYANEKFMSMLTASEYIKFSLIEPTLLVDKFDITSESFSLDGFMAAKLKAKEYCDRIL